MEVYTLDSGFRPETLLDMANTAIWTERYSAAGDFVITAPYSRELAASLSAGTLVGCSVSDDVGIIETRKTENNLIRIDGKFLTYFLRERIIRSSILGHIRNWELTGAPGWIAGQIVEEMCVTGGLGVSTGYPPIPGGTNEVITNLSVGSTATGTSVTIPIPFSDIYSAVQKICAENELGFWMRPANVTASSYELIFSTYKGRDLTRAQSTYPVVSFESALDSLINVKDLESVAAYKNVCYAYGPESIDETGWTLGVAYVDGGDTATNFDRRVMILFADDITEADVATSVPKLTRLLNKRAADALINNNYARMMDGQIVPQLGFQYETDYKLGDIIELKSMTGASQNARITEYIRAKDERGVVAYPTLSLIA